MLASQGKLILVGTAYLVVVSDVFGRLRHCVDAVQFFHQLVRKAPADGGVVDGRGARKRCVCLAHDKRCACHRLHSAGDHQAGVAGLDRPRRRANRIHAGTAQAVDGGAGNFLRQTRQQRRHARHVAIVFAGLVGATVDHVIDFFPVDAGIATHQFAQRHRPKVVGAHILQRSAVTADGRADCIANKCFFGFFHIVLAHFTGGSKVAAVAACNSSKVSPGAISRTASPAGVTSSTARSV